MSKRFYSLDVFRGATVCLMILVNNPGTWSHIYDPLEHAPWHGLTPTDLVFPFFLFAVGNALAFVIPRLRAAGELVFWKKILIRSLLIFAIGLFLTWWPFVKWNDGNLVFKPWSYVDDKGNLQGVRILGVLARIALCYFLGFIIIYYLKPRGAFFTGLIILLGYWVLCFVFGEGDPYSMAGWFGNKVDKSLLGLAHMYKGEGIPFDPEGIMSTLPATVNVIFGFLVGDYIRNKTNSAGAVQFEFEKTSTGTPANPFEMLAGLFVAGVALIVTGFCWDTVFPINKKIWTSSYTVYTSGLATITIATMIYLIEIKNAKGWLSKFFDVFGKNALFVFALSAFLPKGLALIRFADGTNPWNWLYKKVLIHIPGAPENGSVLYAIFVIIFMWFICWIMDKNKIYVKV